MGRSRGLEPPTPGTTNQCSNQLSYDRHGVSKEGSFGRARHLRGGATEGKDGQTNERCPFLQQLMCDKWTALPSLEESPCQSFTNPKQPQAAPFCEMHPFTQFAG
jgi:hypothetical protein